MSTPAPDDAPPPEAGPVPELSPDELAERRRGPRPPVLVDVREPWEHQIARIEGARLVPLGSLGAALSTFDPAEEYVLYCHHGVRSLAGAEFLRRRGLTRVANLAGGIDAWSVRVDPAVPRY
jgi:rhodanese-related sulfurtransferase